jgi:alkylated DNA repair dioxygenase AlkB
MNFEQVSRAAKLVEKLKQYDKDIREIDNAVEISVHSRAPNGSPMSWSRTRTKGYDWADDHGAALQAFLISRYKAGRAAVIRELNQLGVTVPECP